MSNPVEVYNKIIDLLLNKINDKEEKLLTVDQIKSIPIYFSDNNGVPDRVQLPFDIEIKLSEQTIKEIRALQLKD